MLYGDIDVLLKMKLFMVDQEFLDKHISKE